ncbi:hypothetical protein [Kitasatospora sp. NPDC088346]|uniref:hypothetical protein n=1 Tax=Kitasatospora sp. NPDC088346 TaxID=3364073 RepID=UPI0037F7D047
MPTAPTLNGQVIGLAHHATRALLETRLAATGTTSTSRWRSTPRRTVAAPPSGTRWSPG